MSLSTCRGSQEAPRLPCGPLPPSSLPPSTSTGLCESRHPVAMETQAGPGMAVGGQSPLSGGSSVGIRGCGGYEHAWCFVRLCSCDINDRAFCGLGLHALFSSVCFSPPLSVCSLLPGGSKPHMLCHFLWAVVGQTERGPSRCQGQTPGRQVPVGRGCVCFSCVHTEQLGPRWNRSRGHRRARWMVSLGQLSPLPPGSTCLSRYQHEGAGADQALAVARRRAQDAVFPRVSSPTPVALRGTHHHLHVV